MTTQATQIIETLKSNKIGKGCKISYDGGEVKISYPVHKTLNHQYNRDLEVVMSLYSIDVTGNTVVKRNKVSNYGCIQIMWL